MTQFRIASKRRRGLGPALAALLIAGAAASGAQAAGKDEKRARAEVLQQVLDCRAIQDQAQRLACYDGAVAKMDQAEKSGDIVVVDRDQVREARKEAFGFELPKLSLFDRSDKPEQIDRISAVVERAYVNRDGKWVIVLQDGAQWVQVDSEPLNKAPNKGSKAEIRKAAMGSFFMNLDGQRAIRARRVN